MEIKHLKCSDLIGAEYNPRKLSDKQRNELRDSLNRFGFVDPVLVNINDERKNIIIGGHQRKSVWEEMGNKTIPCIELDLTLDQEKELNVRLNKSGGEFDMEMLADHFDQDELIDWGFDEVDFGEDLITLEAEEDGFEEPNEPPAEVDVVLGDIIEIGEHRLMCGDSTCSDTVSKLMDGEKADLVFTDPPYGVSYQSNMRVKSDKFDVLKNDDVFITEWIGNLPLFSRGFVFVWTSWKVLKEWTQFCEEIGDLSNIIIWNKGGGGIGDLKKTFSSDYEVALVYHRGANITGKRIGSVWGVGKDSASSYLHPTQKPIELASTAIKNVLERSKIVLDLFLGSGSTMVAAEQLKRKCYGMELDPKYCQVIINRMHKLDDSLEIKINGDKYTPKPS